MTINVTDNGDTVMVEFVADDGSTASAVVVGESVESVKDRKKAIVDAHDLDSKATQS